MSEEDDTEEFEHSLIAAIYEEVSQCPHCVNKNPGPLKPGANQIHITVCCKHKAVLERFEAAGELRIRSMKKR